MLIDITDAILVRVVDQLMLIAESYGNLLWDAVSEFADVGDFDPDEVNTLDKAWWRACDAELVDSEYFNETHNNEDIFENCIVMLQSLKLVNNNGFCAIMKCFHSLRDYPFDEDSVTNWRDELERTILSSIIHKDDTV